MTVLEITSYGRNTLRRLRQEARIVDRTLLPELAPAYERDPFAPTPTLVTGDLPNITLDDLVGISPLPAAAALHALQDVVAILEAMHDGGLVHADLRPATVFILPDGRAALARSDGAKPVPAKDRGRGRRADAHSFAVLAFELLTGVHPLAPTDAASMAGSHVLLPGPAATAIKRALSISEKRRPLPHALMAALDAIPAEDWPSNGLHRPAPLRKVEQSAVITHTITPRKRPDPSPLAPIELAPMELAPVEVRILPPPVRRSRFRRLLGPVVLLLGLTTVFTGGAAGTSLLFAPTPSSGDPSAEPPHVRRISLSVTPPQALCPYAALHITATIVADGGPGELELRWRLPDGSSTADSQSLAFDGGRRVLRAAIDLTLTGHEQLIGEVIAVVGPAGVRASAPIRYLCRSAVEKDRGKDRARST
jgi:hypothetical protein